MCIYRSSLLFQDVLQVKEGVIGINTVDAMKFYGILFFLDSCVDFLCTCQKYLNATEWSIIVDLGTHP